RSRAGTRRSLPAVRAAAGRRLRGAPGRRRPARLRTRPPAADRGGIRSRRARCPHDDPRPRGPPALVRAARRGVRALSRKGVVLFASMCVIWGIPYLMIRVAVRELTPGTLVFWRTAIAALLLLPIALLRGQIRPLFAHWKALLAYTVIEVAIPWVLLARA